MFQMLSEGIMRLSGSVPDISGALKGAQGVPESLHRGNRGSFYFLGVLKEFQKVSRIPGSFREVSVKMLLVFSGILGCFRGHSGSFQKVFGRFSEKVSVLSLRKNNKGI